jgi:hypothetical protein
MNLGDKLNAVDAVSASLVMSVRVGEVLHAFGRYYVQHVRNGIVIWEEFFPNIVTTVGKNDILEKYLAGAAYTQTLVLGLKGTGTAVLADTQASHAGWLEVGAANAPAYSGTRKTPVFGAAAGGVKATSSAASFTFTSGGTVAGAFMNNGGTSAIDNTTGVLLSAGDFAAPRAVVTSDILNVSWSLTL